MNDLLGWQKAELAFADFEKWVAEHDPDGEMSLLEQIEAYANADRG
jgi:hypothetical protein